MEFIQTRIKYTKKASDIDAPIGTFKENFYLLFTGSL